MVSIWMTFVSGFTFILQYLYQITLAMGVPNYGLAIILFTLIIKAVLFPLTVFQMRSMRAMQDLQPRIKAIQDRFKDKPQKSQEEVMKLYKESGANPLSGCLPLLVQMPILYALLTALRSFFNPVIKHAAHFDKLHAAFLWIPNLGIRDPYFILPILTALATFGQQYVISRTSSGQIDKNQKTMLYVMPLFIGYLANMYPAGLALYWVAFSVFGAAEQLIIMRMAASKKKEQQA